jgi:hypothetical protein
MKDNESPSAEKRYIVISEYADEVLVSDQLASAFGIVIEDPAKGLWRLREEAVVRASEK